VDILAVIAKGKGGDGANSNKGFLPHSFYDLNRVLYFWEPTFVKPVLSMNTMNMCFLSLCI
jgi:hypothetical protein